MIYTDSGKYAIRALTYLAAQPEEMVTIENDPVAQREYVYLRLTRSEGSPYTEDSTGAGDLYASGFLYGLCMEQPLDV